MTKQSKGAIAVGAALIGIAALTAWFVYKANTADETENDEEDTEE